jgi:hypothetical protein
MRVPLVDAIHVTAMINRLKLFLLCLLMVTCVTDYSVVTNPDIIVTQGTTDKDTSEVKDTEVVVEYFVQPDKPENLDVLFVIDTSCSMSDNFENVSAGLDILRGDIEALTYDYQIAMINSSLREVYFVGPYDTNSTSIDIFMAPYFLARDMFEEPFATLYQFTTTPEGISFLRPNVDKLYIFVSDEPEQSVIPVSMFKDWMDEYHSGVQHDIVIIGINDSSPEDCKQFFNLGPDDENRFLTFANYYNKMIIDICGDFQYALADSSFLLTPITHKNLTKQPIEDSIVVYKDGEIQQDWYYLDSTNTVYFEFDIEPNSIIKIGYNSYL